MSKIENNLTNRYKNIISAKSREKLELIGEYSPEEITIKCIVSNAEFKVNGDTFIKNPECECSTCKKRREQVKKMNEITDGEYTVVDEFCTYDKKSKDFHKVWMKHNKCGKVYPVGIQNFLRGSRCPRCTKTPFKTHEQYVDDVNKVGKGNFTVISQYTRATNDVILEHTKGCKESFITKACSFLTDPRCPLCEKAESRKKTREDYRAEINPELNKESNEKITNEGDIALSMSKNSNLSHKQCELFVDNLLKIFSSTLVNGDKVSISKFGTFKVDRDNSTGRKDIKFIISKSFKEKFTIYDR